MNAVVSFGLMFLLFGVVAIVVGVGAEEGAAERPVRGVFLTVEPPALSGDELALLDELEHVASFGQLEAALTEDVSVLAIDESALGVLPAGFLAEQYNSGRAILGINVFARDLAEALEVGLTGPWPTPESWALTHDGHGDGAFYSYLRRSPAGAEVSRSGGGQHHFKDRLFPAVLEQLLEGAWRE